MKKQRALRLQLTGTMGVVVAAVAAAAAAAAAVVVIVVARTLAAAAAAAAVAVQLYRLSLLSAGSSRILPAGWHL